MNERRAGARYSISFPVRVRWRSEDGKEVSEDGLTENVGPQGALIYLPRNLPLVGRKVNLTVTEDPKNEITCTAEVIRLERNAAHPQAALNLVDNLREWKKKVWAVAAETVANQKPEEFDFDN
jgi:hypothetical protein